MTNATPPQSPRYLLLGQISRPHGVRGEMRIRLITAYPERIGQLKTVYIGTSALDESANRYHVKGMRFHKEYGLLQLKELTDRDEVSRLSGLYVMVPFEDAVPLEEDEFYVFQLIGLDVKTEDGTLLGSITQVMETGANDIYVIDSPTYGEVLFPAIDDTIIDHDIANGVVHVRVPDGLLPEDRKPE